MRKHKHHQSAACVNYQKAKGRYIVRIKLPNGERKYIGSAASTQEGIRIRDAAFLKEWGRLPTPEDF